MAGMIKLRIYEFGTFVRHHEKYGFKIEVGGKLIGYKKDDSVTTDDKFDRT